MKRLELIELYLLGQLSETEKLEFEASLSTDFNLAREVEDYRSLQEAIIRKGIREDIKKHIRMKKWIRKGGIGGGAALIAIFAFWASMKVTPATNTEQGFKGNSGNEASLVLINDPLIEQLEVQTFEINNREDVVIETESGLVIAIPAHAFDDSDSNYQILVQEALTPVQILKAGLQTLSNGNLLETGGMFSIQACRGSVPLEIKKPLEVAIPVKEKKGDMQLFQGEKDSAGIINWTNPVPMENYLLTQALADLDFYPEKYLPTLSELNKNTKDRRFTDSLYYSFAGYLEKSEIAPTSFAEKDVLSSTQVEASAPETISKTEEINPARIQAIKDGIFEGSLIATKEFEERIRLIHQSCNPRLLNIYINGASLPMYICDSLASRASNGKIQKEFLKLYQRRDGRVPVDSSLSEKLSTYFSKRYRLYYEASARTWRKFQTELDAKCRLFADRSQQYLAASNIRKSISFQEELRLNYKKTCEQMGAEFCKPVVPVAPAANYYRTSVRANGIYNIDRYVTRATINRRTTTFRDGNKTATISYSPINIQLEQREDYSRVMVYLLPDELSSFIRVNFSGNGFIYSMNDFIKYDLIVLAWKGEELFYYHQKSVGKGDKLVRLSQGNEAGLQLLLEEKNFNTADAFPQELAFRQMEAKEMLRLQQVRKESEERKKIAQSIFPCLDTVPLPKIADIPENIELGN